MATISTVAVDFIANVANYTAGLESMSKKTKAWSGKTKKDAKAATDGFDATGKSIANLAKGLVALVSIQQVGAAFASAAKQVSLLADEAEKVGASAGQFDKLRLAAERNGSDLGTVKIAYKELQKSINEALGGTKTTTSAFKELGLSYVALSKQTPDQQFLRIADALSTVEDQNDRTRLGNLLLGKSFTELAPLIAKGSAGIELGGRGALSDKDIKAIDAVTKSFEEVSRTLDTELKKALVALAPALTTIAQTLTFIIENIDKIIAGFSSIFLLLKGFALFKFGQNALEKYISKTVVSLEGLATTALLTGAPLSKAALATIKYTTALVGFAAAGQAAIASITAIAVSVKTFAIPAILAMGLLVLQIRNVIETLSDLPKFGGYLFPKLKPEFDALSKKVDTAKNGLYEFVSALAAATKAAVQGKPVGPKLPLSEYNRIASNEMDLDRMRQASAEFQKATDAFSKKSSEFNTTLEKSLMTPVEQLTSILEELDDAFLFGGLGIETYNRRLLELAKQYDAATAAAAGLAAPLTARGPNDPKGLLGSSKLPIENFAPDFSKGSSLALVNLANINSAVGGVADSYNTAGENALKFTIAAEAFSDSKLKTFSAVKSDLDALAFVDLAKKLQDSIGGPSAREVFEKQVANINMAAMAVDEYGNSILSAAAKTLALDNATEQYGIASAEAFRKSNEEMYNIVMLTDDFASSFGNAIAAGQSFGEALKNVFQDLTKQIIAMILRSIILQSILQAIGVVTGGVSSVAATMFASMMNIKPMAGGGPVDAGSPYMVGEVGPELFVPRSNGVIIPNDMMGGGGTVVNQTINVQTGVSQTVRAEMLALLPQFRTQAVNAVLETKQRGGSFSKGMAFA